MMFDPIASVGTSTPGPNCGVRQLPRLDWRRFKCPPLTMPRPITIKRCVMPPTLSASSRSASAAGAWASWRGSDPTFRQWWSKFFKNASLQKWSVAPLNHFWRSKSAKSLNNPKWLVSHCASPVKIRAQLNMWSSQRAFTSRTDQMLNLVSPST